MDFTDARTVDIQPEEIAELQPVRRYLLDDETADALSAGATIEPTYRWTWADRAEWALCWFGPAIAVLAALWLIAMVCAKS